MIYLSTFLYYSCFASVILFYGLGLNQIVELSLFKSKSINYLLKVFISIVLSTVISWIITQYILVPVKIVELFPIVCFLVYVCITAFLEALIRITTNKSSTEFLFSYLIVILSVSESSSLLNTLVISGSCLVSLILMMPFTYSFRNRVSKDNETTDKLYVRFFLFIALLIILISVWDIMWLNPEVIK